VERDPPSTKPLLDKLGVKPGMSVAVLGIEDAAFAKQLAARTDRISRGRLPKGADMVFFGATRISELSKLARLKAAIQPAGMIWVVWPKGKPALREDDIRAAALESGLVDVKVAAFSATLSALKLVIPVARRR
jgi:hypothetical protein